MATGTFSYNVSVAGKSATKSAVRTGDGESSVEATLPVAHALTNWVKTDADTAAGDLTAGHGLSTGVFDIYWDGGARYGVTCTITTNAVALDGGTGTDFPASANATVRMSPITTINMAIDGDNLKIGFVQLRYLSSASGQRAHLLFEDAAGDDIADLDDGEGIVASYSGAESAKVYDITGGDTNPFTGDPIATIDASQSSTTEAPTLVVAILVDSTP